MSNLPFYIAHARAERNRPVADEATVITEIIQTCGACPAQWEGKTADGRYVYIRYRHGVGRIGFGATLDDAVDDDTFNWEGKEDGWCSLYDVQTELISSGVDREITFAEGLVKSGEAVEYWLTVIEDPDADEDFT
jgi:hypothetical protein